MRHIDDKRKPGDLLSTLANAADVADRLERDFLEIMRDFGEDTSGGGIWLTKAGPESFIDKKIRHRLDRLQAFIEYDLVKKVNTLFQRVCFYVERLFFSLLHSPVITVQSRSNLWGSSCLFALIDPDHH